ncbi:hypothetical protein GL50803_001979 [Giardia duodenalis]|uniref:Uncharacterized protein n=1 Tax=Giardia intestinalis (strain ATCC 50803 / WB clone C6) TaxID=184922 RepID=A8B2F1_GIAIC|nr:hypothetical protein GL50803_001979 [Giardia intestinalis]KAE8302964.1 hypothetical protein GL50803_001979 [Giardia intestinalis]|eukprot:XP_001709958.1 Hypothetical protein GL50803_1979 [Giardia lamblia ATCC 50803]
MSALELYLVGDYNGAIEKSKQAAKDPGSLAHLAGFLAHMAQGKTAPIPTGGYASALESMAKGIKVQKGSDYPECVSVVRALMDLMKNDPDSAYTEVTALINRSVNDEARRKIESVGFLHYIRILALLQMNQLPLVKREMGLLQAAESGSPLYSVADCLVYGTHRSFNSLKARFGVTEQIQYLAELHGYNLIGK